MGVEVQIIMVHHNKRITHSAILLQLPLYQMHRACNNIKERLNMR